MKKFLLIGAAILIAGAATVAIAADHRGQKRAAPATNAPAVKHAPARPTARKAPPARHPRRTHHAHRSHRMK